MQTQTTDAPRHRRYDHTHTLDTVSVDGGVVTVETAHARGRFIVHHDGTIEPAPAVAERNGEAWTRAAITYLHRADIQSEVYGAPNGSGLTGGGIA